MKKFLMTILILAMLVCGAVGIAACGKDEPKEDQNQGQVEPNKDKDKDTDTDTQKPDTGNENKPGSGSETTPGGDKEDQGDKEENDPPKNPEEEKPGQQTQPETKPEDPKEDEDDKGGEEQTPQNPSNPDDDEPQGDDPSAGGEQPGGETTDPDKDNSGTGGETTDPGKDDPKPDTPKEDCKHVLTYTVVGTDRNTRQHIGKCSLCGKTFPAEKCTFGEPTTVAATCFDNGYDSYICSVCKVEYRAYGFVPGRGYKDPMKAHNLPATWTHVDGSEYKGTSQHTRHCLNEGCTYEEVADCTFDGEFTAPTCTSNGTDNRHCTACGCQPKLLSSALEKLDHDWEIIESKDGINHTKRCKRECCQDEDPVTEPCVYKVTSETEGTCDKKGTTISVCETCHHQKQEENNKNFGHHYTYSNFCDKCHEDGLKCETKRINGQGMQSNVIIRNEDLENVQVIFIPKTCSGLDVHGIDSNAFSNFDKLEKIYFPEGLSAFGVHCLDGTTSLETIYYGGSQNDWNSMLPDGMVREKLSDKYQLPNNVKLECDKDAETVKKEWKLDFTSTATVAALPAEGKRIYD